ncbi:uncharacterized protein L969DRAFT_568587 [Mixia osmundae IAM 14324]|uniref:BRO domain-containing protein 1 n=1 Tax=Mixia osmundae (strain CBS 9802 / IAM 14324 / JCM 22182 / KY 12970) TaxID=764103 RepID=G7DWY3_MIXOS|nr:uncharacterized protein L969DRAFT_568587 [Mixia osmundae IAM 14324]KEI38110.1 hypothetical protein L969DRAFT_568587 [Mixia osmundae IAM 14324]GAA95080.1 hypothetical protein E5Q_01735 [Mixia osmundae IAM 14324]
MPSESPLISVPRKTTVDVDWTPQIYHTISTVYGETPSSYADECNALNRCRQDAVRGSAGSDITGRDLLYKYFGQLELLELRFPDVRVGFPWNDAFTLKQISQHSLAYEKASVIFTIAATLSSLAASQNRSSPEGIKRGFHFFRCSAGMFTYINENFLHAPSTDLSKEVIKALVELQLAQATEIFFGKMTEEKKGVTLKARVCAQAAHLYQGLLEQAKDLVAKSIFDRTWWILLQVKAKHFLAQSQFQRALADVAASKHGDALTRLQIAETTAKEAHRLAQTLTATFFPVKTPSLPADAATALEDITKTHLALCKEIRASTARDNDLIYHATLTSEASLPPIDKSAVATPIPIQEIYATPEVQKVVGADIFARLVPLSVHESASLYSEEKAKVVRSETETCELANTELSAALEHMGLPSSLSKYKAGNTANQQAVLADPGPQVRSWASDIKRDEGESRIVDMLEILSRSRAKVSADLEWIQRELDNETRECEQGRRKYDHLWEQSPSASHTRQMRQSLRNHRDACERAAQSDRHVADLWTRISPEVAILADPTGERVERVFAEAAAAASGTRESNLLDADVDEDEGDDTKRQIAAIEDGLSRLQAIRRERNDVLKDLKERIQADDISHLLILNRKSQTVEPALFAAELEKFKGHQSRIAATQHYQQTALKDVTDRYDRLTQSRRSQDIQAKWASVDRARKSAVARFKQAFEAYGDARAGLGKGLAFYQDLTEVVTGLRAEATQYVNARSLERTQMASQAELNKRLSSSSASQPPPMSPPVQSLEQSLSGMSFGYGPSSGQRQPAQVSGYGNFSPTASTSPYGQLGSFNAFSDDRQGPSIPTRQDSYGGAAPSSYSTVPPRPTPPAQSSMSPGLPPPPSRLAYSSNASAPTQPSYVSTYNTYASQPTGYAPAAATSAAVQNQQWQQPQQSHLRQYPQPYAQMSPPHQQVYDSLQQPSNPLAQRSAPPPPSSAQDRLYQLPHNPYTSRQ